jgi:signal transduction histidine kinase
MLKERAPGAGSVPPSGGPEARPQSAAAPAGGAAPRVRLLRPVLVAGGVVLVLFAAYEVIERFWLRDAELGLLHVLHRVRGVAAALLAAAIASWLVLREGSPLLTAGPLAGVGAGGQQADPARKREHYARWFILMRWLAVGVAALAVIATVEIFHLLPAHVGPRLGAVLVLLTLLNLAYSLHLRRWGASPAFLMVQVYVDVAGLILLLHFSGGIENPLTPLLLLHVIIAGIVLGRVHAYLVAGAASALFAALAWAEALALIPHYTLTVFPHHHVDGMVLHAAHDPLYVGSRVALQALILFLVAYFTTTLSERIREDERELEHSADQALAQAQTLEQALDTTGTALCLCDDELRPVWANARWQEWAAELPELGCGARSADGAAGWTLQDGRVRSDELRVPAGAGGPERVFHLTTAPLRDREGRIRRVVTLARDVTEQHEAQARAMRAERLAAVGDLAGQIAHEVNNPMAIIGAKARLLLRAERDALPGKAAEEIGKIADLTDRVARIAQGLLSYCRPAPGARHALDVRLPMRRALAYVEARAAEAGVRLVDGLPPVLPPVHANAAELEQVFLNLLLNALDAMPAGGELLVSAVMEPRAGEVAVHVADTGAGIPPALLPRVFEPFLTTKGGKGTGLGLSICQGLVRSHGGEIQIDSAPGRGTRVTVRLPAADPGAAPAAASAAARGEGSDA